MGLVFFLIGGLYMLSNDYFFKLKLNQPSQMKLEV